MTIIGTVRLLRLTDNGYNSLKQMNVGEISVSRDFKFVVLLFFGMLEIIPLRRLEAI